MPSGTSRAPGGSGTPGVEALGATGTSKGATRPVLEDVGGQSITGSCRDDAGKVWSEVSAYGNTPLPWLVKMRRLIVPDGVNSGPVGLEPLSSAKVRFGLVRQVAKSAAPGHIPSAPPGP